MHFLIPKNGVGSTYLFEARQWERPPELPSVDLAEPERGTPSTGSPGSLLTDTPLQPTQSSGSKL